MERYALSEHGAAAVRRRQPALSEELLHLGNPYEAACLMAAEERVLGWRAKADVDHRMGTPAGAPGPLARRAPTDSRP